MSAWDRLKVARERIAELEKLNTELVKCVNAIHDCEARLTRAEELLRELEWSEIGNWTNWMKCPVCHWLQADGHAHDCKLDAFLQPALISWVER